MFKFLDSETKKSGLMELIGGFMLSPILRVAAFEIFKNGSKDHIPATTVFIYCAQAFASIKFTSWKLID